MLVYELLQIYAQHLSSTEISKLSKASDGLVGRDIRDVCEHAERQCAARIIKGEVDKDALPSFAMYIGAIKDRISR